MSESFASTMKWTHPQCERCWIELQATQIMERKLVLPIRVEPPELEVCCCGQLTVSGIYRRVDPKTCTTDHRVPEISYVSS